jgi:parallel beta-helix repeat protein
MTIMKRQGLNRIARSPRFQKRWLKAQRPFNLGLVTLLLLTGAVTIAPSRAQTTSAPVAQTPLNARILYVNPAQGRDGAGGGTQTAPFRTISYALQQAQAGTIIQLAPGSYTVDTGEVFPLVVPANVSLRGDVATKGQTVSIIGGGTYVSPSFASQNVTLRPLNSSTIVGVKVTNPNSRGTGIWVESTNPTIQNSTFADSQRDGIFVTGTGAPIIEDNVFTGNSGNGLSITRTARGEVRDNVFQSTGFGIAIGGSSTPLIEGNQVVNNTDGIVVSDTARPVLRRNVVQNNARDGVVAITNAQPDLGTATESGENLITNNSRYDLYNATRTNTLLAIGNEIGEISGQVEFVAQDVNAPTSFPDVQGQWAQAYIEALAARGIIGGFPDGSYRPNEPVTRAQFAAIVAKAFNPTAKRAGANFGDVPSNFWANQVIQTAYRGGFLSGYPGQVFQPGQQISRLEALVSLSSGLNLAAGQPTVLTRYQDQAQIPSWAQGAIAAATQRNIVVNFPNINQLNPNQPATRADIAALVYQALVSSGQAEAIPSPYVVTVQPTTQPQAPSIQPPPSQSAPAQTTQPQTPSIQPPPSQSAPTQTTQPQAPSIQAPPSQSTPAQPIQPQTPSILSPSTQPPSQTTPSQTTPSQTPQPLFPQPQTPPLQSAPSQTPSSQSTPFQVTPSQTPQPLFPQPQPQPSQSQPSPTQPSQPSDARPPLPQLEPQPLRQP